MGPLLASALSPAVGIDLGNEYAKIAVTSPSHKLDIVLNQQSGRKTRSAIQLSPNPPRKYDAQGQKPEEVVEYFSDLAFSSLLPEKYYPYSNVSAPEAFTNYLSILKDLLNTSVVKPNPALSMENTVAALVTPVGLTYRERQRLAQLSDMVGFKTVGLVPSPIAAAVAHSLDLNPSLKEKEVVRKLILDIGSRHIQSCLVEFENVPTHPESKTHLGARATNFTSEIREVECFHADMMGTHALDMILGEHILDKFLGQPAQTVEDIPPRVYRTLVKVATKAKHALSVSPQTRVMYDNLYNGKDLNLSITRKDFEEVLSKSSWFKDLERHLKTWAKKSVQNAELIGNGWRVPKLHEAISNWFGQKKLSLKCNSDEAAVVGATVVATNHSQVYKFKPTYLRMTLPEDFLISAQALTCEKCDTYNPISQPLKIPTNSQYGTSYVYKANNVTVLGDHIKVKVETGDGSSLYHIIKLTGFDTIKKMRTRSITMLDEKRKLYDEAVAANFTTTVTTAANETITVPLPAKHEWIESGEAAMMPLNHYDVTIKMQITPSGLVKIRNAYVNWIDVQVQERRIDHQVTLPSTAGESTQPPEAAGSESTGPTPIPTETAADASNSTEAVESTATTASSSSVTVSSYEWRVTNDVRRNRSLIVNEVDIGTKEAEEHRMVKPLPFTKRELSRLRTALHERIKKDEALERLNEMKNTLESNIYKLQDQLRSWEEEKTIEHVAASDADKLLNETVDWLFTAEVGVEAVSNKMAEIEKLAKSLRLAASGPAAVTEKTVQAEATTSETNQSKHVEL